MLNLVDFYLSVRHPFAKKQIEIHQLKLKQFDLISQTNHFFIFEKQYTFDALFYRAVIRVKKENEQLNLDVPFPFLIAKQIQKLHAKSNDRFVYADEKFWHSNDYSNPFQFIEAGVPKQIIDQLLQDFK